MNKITSLSIWVIIFSLSLNSLVFANHGTLYEYNNEKEISTNYGSTIKFSFDMYDNLYDDNYYNFPIDFDQPQREIGYKLIYLNWTFGYKLINLSNSPFYTSNNDFYYFGPNKSWRNNSLFIENDIKDEIFFYLEFSIFECNSLIYQCNPNSIKYKQSLAESNHSLFNIYLGSSMVYPILYKNLYDTLMFVLISISAILGFFFIRYIITNPKTKIIFDNFRSFLSTKISKKAPYIPLNTNTPLAFISSAFTLSIINLAAFTVLIFFYIVGFGCCSLGIGYYLVAFTVTTALSYPFIKKKSLIVLQILIWSFLFMVWD